MLDGYKTYLGIFFAILPTVASLFHFDASTIINMQADIANLIGAFITIGGGLLAAYGRKVAKPAA